MSPQMHQAALVCFTLTVNSPTSLFPALQERSQLDLLKQELETYAVPVNLKWAWKEESQGTILEKNWTDIVESSSVRTPLSTVNNDLLQFNQSF